MDDQHGEMGDMNRNNWSNVPPDGQCSMYRSQWQTNQIPNPFLSAAGSQPQHLMLSKNNLGPMVGLQALCTACTEIYPDQPNPLQVTARIKYWLGGPDPLDYISMYWNSGSSEQNIPPHWHYVSFGLSDLHGDGRVHPPTLPGNLQTEQISGLGLELSFRVIGEPGRPPLWPAALLQRLATYVFKTGNRFCVGDHISWHSALDGSDVENNTELDSAKKLQIKTKIRHMLITEDPQLGTINTPLGKVQFVQIVGVTDKELKAAKKAGGAPILEALAIDNSWFVTNLARRNSVKLPQMTHTPSDLSGVAATCRWEYWKPDYPSTSSKKPHQTSRDSSELSQDIKEEIKCVLQKGLTEINSHNFKDINANKNGEGDQKSSTKLKEEATYAGNDCKMSTDSIKFGLIDDCLKCIPPFKSNFSINNSSQKDLIMSTDSFEMSKIGIALMEDINHDSNSKIKDSHVKEETNPNTEEKSNVSESQINMASNSIVDVRKQLINPNNNCIKSPSGTFSNQNPCKCESAQKDKMNTAVNISREQYCNKCAVNEPFAQKLIPLPGVHLIFDQEAGSVLPLALRCRIIHGRHFTWEAIGNEQAITLVASNVSGAMVSSEKPITSFNGWLQILITDEFAEKMAKDVEVLLENDADDSDEENTSKNLPLNRDPLVFVWPNEGLKITVLRNV